MAAAWCAPITQGDWPAHFSYDDRLASAWLRHMRKDISAEWPCRCSRRLNLDLAIVRRCVRSYRRKWREISAVFTLVTTARRDHVGVVDIGRRPNPRAGSGRAITGLPAFARLAP